MEEHWNFLNDNNIDVTYFIEPDANNIMRSICFLVPNRVFNKKDYPDYIDYIKQMHNITKIEQIQLKDIYLSIAEHENSLALYTETFNQWCNFLGGQKYGKLRVFLNQFRLA